MTEPPLPSSRLNQVPLTKPGAEEARGTTLSRRLATAPSRSWMVTLTTTAYMAATLCDACAHAQRSLLVALFDEHARRDAAVLGQAQRARLSRHPRSSDGARQPRARASAHHHRAQVRPAAHG